MKYTHKKSKNKKRDRRVPNTSQFLSIEKDRRTIKKKKKEEKGRNFVREL